MATIKSINTEANKLFQQNIANLRNPFGPKKAGPLQQSITPPPLPKPPIPGEGLPRVVHYCADQSGCAFWRMLWPGEDLLAHNKAVIMTLYQMITYGQFYLGIDAVKLQRQCTEPQLEFIKFLRSLSDDMKEKTGKGFKIIWEVDDIICPSHDIPDYNFCKSAFVDDNILATVREVMKYVDEMTVVSEFMRKHYQKWLSFDKISVIPNYAPRMWIDRGYDVERVREKFNKNKKKPRVLYAGSGTHFDVQNKVNQKDDFDGVVNAIAKDILVDHKYEWVFLGAIPLKLRQFIDNGIEFHPWCAITEYPEKIKSLNVDISIAPLQDNNFSNAKANIKLTEAGAQGIPCIAQNLACYNSDGWKYLFDTSDELFSILEKITATEESYMEASNFARSYAEKYVLDKHLDEHVLIYTTPYGDPKRLENPDFVRNNKHQFSA